MQASTWPLRPDVSITLVSISARLSDVCQTERLWARSTPRCFSMHWVTVVLNGKTHLGLKNWNSYLNPSPSTTLIGSKSASMIGHVGWWPLTDTHHTCFLWPAATWFLAGTYPNQHCTSSATRLNLDCSIPDIPCWRKFSHTKLFLSCFVFYLTES